MATNKTVFFMIGILLVVLGISMLPPYLMQLIYEEKSHSFVSSSSKEGCPCRGECSFKYDNLIARRMSTYYQPKDRSEEGECFRKG